MTVGGDVDVLKFDRYAPTGSKRSCNVTFVLFLLLGGSQNVTRTSTLADFSNTSHIEMDKYNRNINGRSD